MAGIEGIQTITSRSRDGASDITIEFNPGRDIDTAANDVRDRVSGAAGELPEEALSPEVRKADADAGPIMFFVVSKPGWSRLQLSDYVDRNLVDRISAIDGVARVFVSGEARPSMRIWLQPHKLAAFGLTPTDVETALRRQNVELPAGRLESVNQNVTLRVSRLFSDPESFAGLVIARGDNGYLVRLGDISRIEEGAENPYQSFRFNGQPAVGLGVVRQSGANTLAVANAAKTEVAAMRANLPQGMIIDVGSDDSQFIARAIDRVYETLIEAAILVVLVIFLFLGNWRATLIPAVTVPICLLGGFAVLWFAGMSINLLTLLAMVLAIGLVVDDAIVVLENVYHRIEKGEPPNVAAFLGARQVGFAVISTTLVVCAVFVPIMFLAGQTGLLFRELAVAMIAAVGFSGFLALGLAPMLCSKLLKFQQRSRFTKQVDEGFRRFENVYSSVLNRVILRPAFAVAATAIFVVSATFLFMTMTSELVPQEDMGIASATLTASEGTGFATMDGYVVRVQDKLLPLVEEGTVRGIIARTPGGFGVSDDFNSGSLTVFLHPWEEREKTTQDVADQVNKILREQPAIRGNASVRSPIGGRESGSPISFVIAGNSYDELAVARDRIFAAAQENPGIINLDSDYKETKPQLLINVDMVRAGDLGVSVNDISQALQSLLGSRRVSTYLDRGEEYRVIVQADAADRANLENLATMQVRGRDGVMVPLSSLVTTQESAGPRDLGRYQKIRAITLSGALAPDYTLGQALTFLEEQAAQSPEVIAIGYRGQSLAFKQTGGSIWVVLGLTVLVIFLLLAAQFESYVHPLTIITTVPLAIAGGLFGLWLMGQTINLYSQIGIVMLVGLAAKNGILIVEFANQLRDEGMVIGEAIRIASARRLRPILMTSIATVMGALPLIIVGGAGAASRTSIGVVIVFGVSISTFITLFLIPILYSRLAKYTGSPDEESKRLDQALVNTVVEETILSPTAT